MDLSAAAQETLSPDQDERTTFICADANTYEPTERFDAIIFNESLYYLDAPTAVMDRCMRALNEDGMIIVSTFAGSHRALAILKSLKARYKLFDETRTAHASKAWICSVFKKESSGQGHSAAVALSGSGVDARCQYSPSTTSDPSRLGLIHLPRSRSCVSA